MIIEFECAVLAPFLKGEDIADSKELHIRHKDGKVWLTSRISPKRPMASRVENIDPSLFPLEIMSLEPISGIARNAGRVRIEIVRSKRRTGIQTSVSYV